MDMLIYTLCVLLGVVSQLTAIEERIGDRDAPKLEGGRIDPDLEGDKPDDRFLTVDEELARIDLLPKTSFEKLTPEVQKWQTEELKVGCIIIIIIFNYQYIKVSKYCTQAEKTQ